MTFCWNARSASATGQADAGDDAQHPVQTAAARSHGVRALVDAAMRGTRGAVALCLRAASGAPTTMFRPTTSAVSA